ncbi:hypothetical protein [Brevundimonas sp.]|jgi:hypothetical protein|uniref:hypothetical protein n=1 Tax=Brevundimonas sp. TaxID=1871086 RepID=UPI002E109E54|nr:hypothetical protein [Brevundimonas sp.]
MIEPQRNIPDWYKTDWTPATGPDRLPTMTWEDVETVLDQLAGTPRRKAWAEHLLSQLQEASAHLSPMDLLQQIVLTASAVTAPTAEPPVARTTTRRPRKGNLPSWSLTDLEWAINYSVSGPRRRVALERQRDLLRRRHELCSGAETLRSIFLIAAGLLSGRTLKTQRRTDLSDAA